MTQPWVRDLYLGAIGSVVGATATARTRPSRPPGGPERRPHMSAYEITIDPSLCSGYGACVDVSRDLFRLEKGGIATVIRPPHRRPGRARRRRRVPDGRDLRHGAGGGSMARRR